MLRVFIVFILHLFLIFVQIKSSKKALYATTLSHWKLRTCCASSLSISRLAISLEYEIFTRTSYNSHHFSGLFCVRTWHPPVSPVHTFYSVVANKFDRFSLQFGDQRCLTKNFHEPLHEGFVTKLSTNEPLRMKHSMNLVHKSPRLPSNNPARSCPQSIMHAAA